MRRIITTALAAALIVSACGSDDSSSDNDASSSVTEAPPATEPPVTEPAATEPPATDPAATEPAATESAATEPAATEPAATEPAATEPAATDAPVEGDAVAVSLVEWEVVAPTEYAAGPVTFEATNDGEFPHEFVLVRGDSYETLPQLPNGAIDEESLAAGDIIGRIERFEPTETASATWEVEPGNYVLLCNIAVGPNSHAAAGQVLSISVT